MKYRHRTCKILKQVQNDINEGFTIVELIIVITIVLILSSAAISGTAGLIKNLRFNNTFNKVIFMVQQARNMAVTGKSTGVTSYTVYFYANKVELKAQKVGSTDTLSEITLGTDFNLVALPGATGSCSDASISFNNGNAETTLTCTGSSSATDVKSLTVSLQEIANSSTGLTRSFSIYSASGIPQVK